MQSTQSLPAHYRLFKRLSIKENAPLLLLNVVSLALFGIITVVMILLLGWLRPLEVADIFSITITGTSNFLIVILILGTGVLFAIRLGGGVAGYQMGLGKLWSQAMEFISGTPAGTPGQAKPSAGGPLVFTEGFKTMHEVDPQLVGDPIENVAYDGTGNGYQNTKAGTLFWLKSTNTVYFFTKEALYSLRNDKIVTLDKTRQ